MDASERAPEVDYHSYHAPEAYHEAPIAVAKLEPRYQETTIPRQVAESDRWNDDESARLPGKPAARSKGARIGGLPVLWFWLLLALLGFVVIGASVGGAVGGSAATKASEQSVST